MNHHHEIIPQFDAVRRLGFVPCRSNFGYLTARVSPAEGVKCFGNFGSGDKIQETTNTQIGASEEATQASATGDLSTSTTGGIALGLGASLGNTTNLGTITYTDGGAFDLARGFADNYGKTISELVGKQTEATAAQASNTNGLLQNLLAGFGALVESKNTDGASSQNKTVLYIGLAIAAVVAIFFWRKSR